MLSNEHFIIHDHFVLQIEILLLLFLTVHTILRYVWYGVKDGIHNALIVQKRTTLMVATYMTLIHFRNNNIVQSTRLPFMDSQSLRLDFFSIQMFLLILMYIDIILELSYEPHINHVRVIRALRSLFVIDNYLLSGVRRYSRTIFFSSMHILSYIHDYVCMCNYYYIVLYYLSQNFA